ncbi:MAG: Gfo/Idh/MocA family oxidoreductase, partial [Candidatus Poribacteria bacterium]|nr:Gfo/Idh/MocA family oxidoreductase [Candidatus Poribacteria bacterium]
MEAPIRVGVIGLVHERIWENVQHAVDLPYVEFVGAADTNEKHLKQFAETTGCGEDALYQDVQKMLDEREMDAVIGGLLSHEHVALTDLCAERGLALFTEKPMASTLDAVDSIVTAVQRSEIRFMVNFPRLWNRALREAVVMAQNDAIGELFHIRTRIAEKREKKPEGATPYSKWLFSPDLNPTGAVLDLCGYGAQIASWVLGKPSVVVASGATMLQPGLNVPDGGVMVMKYDKAFATAEGMWSPYPEDGTPMVQFFGTKGQMSVLGETLRLHNDMQPDGADIEPKPPSNGRQNGI